MIRKRIKKRRNPSEEEELRERRLEVYKNLGLFLYNVVEDGNPENLVNAIILYNQGYVCGDCYNEELGEEPKDYLECVCEKCPRCGFRRDLCYLDIDYKGPKAEDYSKEERERVKEAGYELILEILADDLYNDGRKYSIIPDNKYKNLNKLKKEFLNSILQKDDIDLSYAILSRVDLSGANLSGANLSRVDLSGANLSGANLSGANLYGASLYGANFTNAKINNTNFTNVYHINKAIGLIIPNPRKKSIRRRK